MFLVFESKAEKIKEMRKMDLSKNSIYAKCYNREHQNEKFLSSFSAFSLYKEKENE
jgi:hypothetical protein